MSRRSESINVSQTQRQADPKIEWFHRYHQAVRYLLEVVKPDTELPFAVGEALSDLKRIRDEVEGN
jgi:hypothetical protein